MNIRVRGVIAGAFLLSLTGCGFLFGEDAAAVGGEDAGAAGCEKDREKLSELLVTEQPCTTTAECQTSHPGSFCNPEMNACDWECYSDSDCGFGFTCSCIGQCSDSPDPSAARRKS